MATLFFLNFLSLHGSFTYIQIASLLAHSSPSYHRFESLKYCYLFELWSELNDWNTFGSITSAFSLTSLNDLIKQFPLRWHSKNNFLKRFSHISRRLDELLKKFNAFQLFSPECLPSMSKNCIIKERKYFLLFLCKSTENVGEKRKENRKLYRCNFLKIFHFSIKDLKILIEIFLSELSGKSLSYDDDGGRRGKDWVSEAKISLSCKGKKLFSSLSKYLILKIISESSNEALSAPHHCANQGNEGGKCTNLQTVLFPEH